MDYKKICNKLLDLSTHKEIEISNYYINMVEISIRTCKLQIEHLEDNKPLWFQKKKLEVYNEEKEKLNNKLYNYYLEIEKEIAIMKQLQE